MKYWTAILLLSLAATGCVSKATAKLREQNAYLAGQNSILMQQHQAAQDSQTASITILGQVQNSKVPWVAGLTLAQAITTANYLGADQPKQITITRNGETATMDATAVMNGANVPLQIGDVVELK